MKTYKFKKQLHNRWYIQLDEWTGSNDDLEMVLGADTLLDIISEGENEVNCIISETYFEGSEKLEQIGLGDEFMGGSNYILKTYKGIGINLDVWLCDVTKFVFGYFPKIIYICKNY